MQSFKTLTAIAAPLPVANVDTDKILPAKFLKTTTRDGLGKALFAAVRYNADDTERADFVLNRAPWRNAAILIAEENFGCGSSREHAPWALADFGIRCIIAPSFADIFHNNCFKNGILPIELPRATTDILMADAQNPETATLSIDLLSQTVTRTNGKTISFAIDEERKAALYDGLDDIAQSLRHRATIDAFEANSAALAPWVYAGVAAQLEKVLSLPDEHNQ
nr:3-isopropylmalate dehydratase small subunit [Sphingomonas sp. CDS-1]